MCLGIIFLWQVNNCPVGFFETLLKTELLPKKNLNFQNFLGLSHLWRVLRHPSLQKLSFFPWREALIVTRFFWVLVCLRVYKKPPLIYRRLSWLLIHITNIMYQLTMTQKWFVNGQGDIILIDLCRQNPTDLCKLFSHTNYYQSQSCAINSVYCTTMYVWKLLKSYRSPLNGLNLFTSGNSPNLAKTPLLYIVLGFLFSSKHFLIRG